MPQTASDNTSSRIYLRAEIPPPPSRNLTTLYASGLPSSSLYAANVVGPVASIPDSPFTYGLPPIAIASPADTTGSIYAGSISEASDLDFWCTTSANISQAGSAATSPGGEDLGQQSDISSGTPYRLPCGPAIMPLGDSAVDAAGSWDTRNRSAANSASPSPVSFVHVTASDFSGDKGSEAPLVRPQDVSVALPVRKRVRARPTVEERIASGRIPRPPNSFILYRSAQYRRLSETGVSKGDKLAQADWSRLIAQMWCEESPSVKEAYVRQAAEEKERHAQRFPDYTYRPVMPPRRRSAKKKGTSSSVSAAELDALVASTSSSTSAIASHSGSPDSDVSLSCQGRSSIPAESPPGPPSNWRLFRSTISHSDPPLACAPPELAALSGRSVTPPSDPDVPLSRHLEGVLPVPPSPVSVLESQTPTCERELFVSFEDMLASSPISGLGNLFVDVYGFDPLPDYEQGVENALHLSGLRDFAGAYT